MKHNSGFDLFIRTATVIARKKRLILAGTLLPTIACVIIVLLMKSQYKAEALVLPPSSGSGSSSLESMVGGSSGIGLLGSLLGSTSEDADECLNILGSTLFAEKMIEKFDLETDYRFKGEGRTKKYFRADVLKAFRKRLTFEITDEDALAVSIRSSSPEKAAEMVEHAVFLLDSLYIALQKTMASGRLRFVDERLKGSREEMETLEDSINAFQNKNNLVVPQAQVRLIMENLAQTEIRLETVKQELELETALRGTESPRYRDLILQKRLLEEMLEKQFHQNGAAGSPQSLFHSADGLPGLSTDYLRLEREYAIRVGVFRYLSQQAEALKLDASKNMHQIAVLDPPWVNDKRVSPKRRVMVQIVFLLSLIISLTVAATLSHWEVRSKEDPELAASMRRLRGELFRL